MNDYQQRDLAHIWHPCSQMKDYESLPPLFVDHAKGAWLYDEKGKAYLDIISSWWANLLGHGNPVINERIKAQLEDHQVTLMKDIAMLDKMYQLNLVYFKELSMYILAGRKKLQQVRENALAAAEAKAKASGLPEDAQAARDLADQCDRFEKKLYDLELTRNISIQMGPQIRLIQSNDTMMAEKIQTTIVNTIPLWKNQMVLALGMAHSQQAMQAERAVTDATNELLRKNAATLKQGTIDIAKESERGVVDIETLQQTNRDLISTLDELNKIRADGKAKRAAAEQELGRIEGELKQKLLEINK